jgi:hypothetical protein
MAGVVDTEVEHDAYGIPFIGGKTLRGLLRDSWLSMEAVFPELVPAAGRVLGHAQALDDECRLRIGDATVSAAVRDTIVRAVEQSVHLTPNVILEAFTTIRFQTAENRATGAPDATTLRTSRVVLRDFTFDARLTWLDGYRPNGDDVRVLAACALATRHGGLLRNRGRGHLQLTLGGDLSGTRRLVEAAS